MKATTRSIIALVAVLALAQTIEATKVNSFIVKQDDDTAEYTKEQIIEYYFAIGRGLIDGFVKGLYNNKSEAVDP